MRTGLYQKRRISDCRLEKFTTKNTKEKKEHEGKIENWRMWYLFFVKKRIETNVFFPHMWGERGFFVKWAAYIVEKVNIRFGKQIRKRLQGWRILIADRRWLNWT